MIICLAVIGIIFIIAGAFIMQDSYMLFGVNKDLLIGVIVFSWGIFLESLVVYKFNQLPTNDLDSKRQFIKDSWCTLKISKPNKSVWYCPNDVTYHFPYTAEQLQAHD